MSISNPNKMHPVEAGPSASIFEKEDPITGLSFVAWFFAQTQKDPKFYPLERSTITFFNVMSFKTINQRFSYQGGNKYLCKFRDELQKLFEGEKVLRAGADHLVVISLNLSVEEIALRIKLLNKAMSTYEGGLRNQIKAGIYIADGTPQQPIVMMDRASIACREVHGIFNREYAVFDEELRKKHEQKQYVLEHFEEAFEKGYFKVFYQPIYRSLNKKVCGYEALARWIDPNRGMISPLIFIEVLEKVHLIHKLDAYIIEQACKDLRDDIDSGFAYQPISVNLSRLDFELSDIKKVVDNAVAKYNVPKEYIVLEVTESAFASDLSNLGEVISAFRADGYQVWIDDFGSGYSSFNNLQTYDFDFLKIDMNFLRNFDKTPKSKVIIASIVDLAKKLGIHTLAEGVETEDQYEYLKQIGCELIQGYYFSKPLPVEDFHTRRTDLCDFKTNETPKERQYYDGIGLLNFLENTPLRERQLEITNEIPIAIVEGENRKYRFIFVNSAFKDIINLFGAGTPDEVLKQLYKHGPSDLASKRYAALLYSERHHKTIEFHENFGNVKLLSRARFLSRMDNKVAYAFVIKLL